MESIMALEELTPEERKRADRALQKEASVREIRSVRCNNEIGKKITHINKKKTLHNTHINCERRQTKF